MLYLVEKHQYETWVLDNKWLQVNYTYGMGAGKALEGYDRYQSGRKQLPAGRVDYGVDDVIDMFKGKGKLCEGR